MSFVEIVVPQEEYEQLDQLLKEIEDKIGPYKMDNHEHALSVMENSSRNAKRIREILSVSTSETRSQEETQ